MDPFETLRKGPRVPRPGLGDSAEALQNAAGPSVVAMGRPDYRHPKSFDWFRWASGRRKSRGLSGLVREYLEDTNTSHEFMLVVAIPGTGDPHLVVWGNPPAPLADPRDYDGLVFVRAYISGVDVVVMRCRDVLSILKGETTESTDADVEEEIDM